jgi:hypothetical protein
VRALPQPFRAAPAPRSNNGVTSKRKQPEPAANGLRGDRRAARGSSPTARRAARCGNRPQVRRRPPRALGRTEWDELATLRFRLARQLAGCGQRLHTHRRLRRALGPPRRGVLRQVDGGDGPLVGVVRPSGRIDEPTTYATRFGASMTTDWTLPHTTRERAGAPRLLLEYYRQ